MLLAIPVTGIDFNDHGAAPVIPLADGRGCSGWKAVKHAQKVSKNRTDSGGERSDSGYCPCH